MQKREAEGRPFVPTALFVVGYLLAWVGFSVLATLANWGLHLVGLLSSMMGSTCRPVVVTSWPIPPI